MQGQRNIERILHGWNASEYTSIYVEFFYRSISTVAARTYIPPHLAGIDDHCAIPPPLRFERSRKSSFLVVVQFDRSIESRLQSSFSPPSGRIFSSPLVLTKQKIEKPRGSTTGYISFIFEENEVNQLARQVVGTLTIGQWLLRERERHPTVPEITSSLRVESTRIERKRKKKKKEARRPLNALDLFSFKRIPLFPSSHPPPPPPSGRMARLRFEESRFIREEGKGLVFLTIDRVREKKCFINIAIRDRWLLF